MLRPQDGEVGHMTAELTLQDQVLNELRWERLLVDPAAIRVEVRDGYVTLAGLVDSQEARAAAEWAAGRVPGVKGVESELMVRPAPERIIN
jgi:osmotically-inducible protein OsmY